MNDDVKHQLKQGYMQINVTNLISILILTFGITIVLVSSITLIKSKNSALIINTQLKDSKIISEDVHINLISQPDRFI